MAPTRAGGGIGGARSGLTLQQYREQRLRQLHQKQQLQQPQQRYHSEAARFQGTGFAEQLADDRGDSDFGGARRKSEVGLPPGVARARQQALWDEDEEAMYCRYEPLGPLVLRPYLEGYGFKPDEGGACWLETPGASELSAPRLSLRVMGHEEIDGHTLYTVECEFIPAGATAPSATWRIQRRLSHLREDIHDRIKAMVGDAYAKLFASVPFAAHGGLPGTTSRLSAWLGRFADCVNSGKLPPAAAALALHYFEAPDPSECLAVQGEDDDVAREEDIDFTVYTGSFDEH